MEQDWSPINNSKYVSKRKPDDDFDDDDEDNLNNLNINNNNHNNINSNIKKFTFSQNLAEANDKEIIQMMLNAFPDDELVASLLAIKIQGKKYDYKIRCDTQTDCIRKYREFLKEVPLRRREAEAIAKQLEQHVELQKLLVLQEEAEKRNEMKVKYEQEIQKLTTKIDKEKGFVRVDPNEFKQIEKTLFDLRLFSESQKGELDQLHNDTAELRRALAEKDKLLQEKAEELNAANIEAQLAQSHANFRIQEEMKKSSSLETLLQKQVDETGREKMRVMALEERLETCAHTESRLNEQLRDCNQEISLLMGKEQQYNFTIQQLQAQIQTLNQTIEEGETKLREETDRFTAIIKEKTGIINNLRADVTALEANVVGAGMSASLGQGEERQQLLARTKELAASQNKTLQELTEQVEILRKQNLDAEEIRRKLHNQIQDMRGKVRVIARIRPSNSTIGIEQSQHGTSYSPLRILSASTVAEITPTPGGASYQFGFDKVFGGNSTQAEVWEEVSNLVQSALDGYQVCLLAYGQTGSGKTHTMIGGGTEAQRGVIPRAMEMIMKESVRLRASGWTYKMTATFVEIYNEGIRDLLNGNRVEELSSNNQHHIKHDEFGRMYVSDIEEVVVTTHDEMMNVLHRASSNRSTSKTDMNSVSSRSHAVFSLRLVGTNPKYDKAFHGCLNLVDLAGSEKLRDSHAVGSAMKETVAINKSLSSLADVFTAISNKQSHVPFRNSKLTYLLQPSLSGDGKAMVIINLSPEEPAASDSLCSLRFASTIGSCELGKPKKQTMDIKPSGSSSSSSASENSVNSNHSTHSNASNGSSLMKRPVATSAHSSASNLSFMKRQKNDLSTK